MIRLHRRTFVVLSLLIISVLVALALLFDVSPFLRGGFGWRWPYEPLNEFALRRMLPGIAAVAVYLIGLALLRNRSTSIYLMWVLVGSVVIPVSFLALPGSPFYVLYTRTVSLLTTGAYLKAAEFSALSDLLVQWPAEMAESQAALTHMSTSPPGWPVAYLLTTKLLEAFPQLAERTALFLRTLQCDNLPLMSHGNAQIASAWLGLLSPLWGALTVLPLYQLGRELDEDNAARSAVAWWPLVPSMAVFMATLNTAYPLMITTTVLVFVAGLNRQRSRPLTGNVALFLAGVMATACLMVNFVMVPVFLLCALLLVLYQPAGATTQSGSWWLDRVRMGVPFAVGTLLALLVFRLVTGYHLHSLVPLALGEHLNLERAYFPWLWLHIWDVVLFVGLPIFSIYVLSLFRLPHGRMRQFGIAVALTILIMVLSGTGRGETGRLWNFFMPFFLLGMAAFFVHSKVRWERAFWPVQVGWFLVILAVIRAVGTDLTAPPVYASIVAPPMVDVPFIPVNAEFGEDLVLTGFQSDYIPDTNQIILDLAWQAQKQPTMSYLFSLLAVDPQGAVQSVKEWLPLDYQYPTTCWLPANGIIRDQVVIELPDNAAAGDWWLSLSAFTLDEEEFPRYLAVTLPNGVRDSQQTGLGPVSVAP